MAENDDDNKSACIRYDEHVARSCLDTHTVLVSSISSLLFFCDSLATRNNIKYHHIYPSGMTGWKTLAVLSLHVCVHSDSTDSDRKEADLSI